MSAKLTPSPEISTRWKIEGLTREFVLRVKVRVLVIPVHSVDQRQLEPEHV